MRVHQRPGSSPGPGPGPGRAPPPRPRSGLIRTTLQGSERFAREGEAPAPAASRPAARGRLGCGCGCGDRQGAGPLAWRPPPPVEESNPFAERAEGGDIRGLSRARRKGEGGGDLRPV